MIRKIILFFLCCHVGFSFAENQTEQINLSGTVEVLVEDYFQQDFSKTQYFLNVEEGLYAKQRLQLNFQQTLKEPLMSGDKIAINGFFLKKNEVKVLQWHFIERNRLLNEPLVGTRKAIYFQVNLLDLNTTFSIEKIISKMQMNRDWYQKASYNQVDFSLDVNGDNNPDVYSLTINYSKSQGCNASQLANETFKAARAAGIDMSLYQHRVLILPPSLKCGWSGLGHVGCNHTCNSWIASPDWNLVYPHELGHNLGMHHAGIDANEDGNVESEYGDGSCPMGNILKQGYFNAPHTWQMQWLKENPGNVKTITEAGDFELFALGHEPSLSKLQMIRVPRLNSNIHYYLSYRPQNEFDLVQDKFNWGVSLHSYSSGSTVTHYHRTLSNGETWYGENIRIRQTEKTPDSVKLNILTQCFLPFEMKMFPAITTVFPDKPASFVIELFNPNNATCEPMNVALSAVLPAGFQAVFEKNDVPLLPNEKQTVSMQLSTTLWEGQHQIAVVALDPVNEDEMVIASRVYVQKSPLRTLSGLHMRHYNGTWDRLPDFSLLTPDVEKIVGQVSLGEYVGKNNFGLVFTGFIQITEAGTYHFGLSSEDGSKMYLRDTLLIDNDGLHIATKVSKSVTLVPGLYPIRIEFFEKVGGEELRFYWRKDLEEETEVSNDAFFYQDTSNLAPHLTVAKTYTIKLGKKVTLKGKAEDEDGYITEAGWRLLSGPRGAFLKPQYELIDLNYIFQPSVIGVYQFEFYAKDNSGAQTTTPLKLTVMQ